MDAVWEMDGGDFGETQGLRKEFVMTERQWFLGVMMQRLVDGESLGEEDVPDLVDDFMEKEVEGAVRSDEDWAKRRTEVKQIAADVWREIMIELKALAVRLIGAEEAKGAKAKGGEKC